MVAAVALALIVSRQQIEVLLAERFAAPAPTPVALTATPTPETGPPSVRALVTSNLYASPDRAAEVVAVLPAEQRAVLDGRTTDSAWVRVAYPVGSPIRGWTRASSVQVEPRLLAAAPAVAIAPAVATPTATVAGTPDLALSEVFLIDGKQLAVAVRNLGDTPVAETVMTLDVRRAEGDVVGVLTIEPAALDAGQSATVVTPLAISEPGSYRLFLNPGAGAKDAQLENNQRQVLLIPGAD